jgi:hypothetical protein
MILGLGRGETDVVLDRAWRPVETTRQFRPAAKVRFNQYWSELTTTPSFLAWIASQTGNAIEFLTK